MQQAYYRNNTFLCACWQKKEIPTQSTSISDEQWQKEEDMEKGRQHFQSHGLSINRAPLSPINIINTTQQLK
jgi:hypothetical protein